MVRTSFCHCFSNQEELTQDLTTKRSYLSFCVVIGQKGAVEFSFRTNYIDQSSDPSHAKFYGVKSELEEDQKTPKKVRVHSKTPLKNDTQKPCEKPFMRSSDLYYSYSVNLDLHKLTSMKDNPNTYLRTIHSKDLYEEMKAVYSNIFKASPTEVEGDHFAMLVD